MHRHLPLNGAARFHLSSVPLLCLSGTLCDGLIFGLYRMQLGSKSDVFKLSIRLSLSIVFNTVVVAMERSACMPSTSGRSEVVRNICSHHHHHHHHQVIRQHNRRRPTHCAGDSSLLASFLSWLWFLLTYCIKGTFRCSCWLSCPCCLKLSLSLVPVLLSLSILFPFFFQVFLWCGPLPCSCLDVAICLGSSLLSCFFSTFIVVQTVVLILVLVLVLVLDFGLFPVLILYPCVCPHSCLCTARHGLLHVWCGDASLCHSQCGMWKLTTPEVNYSSLFDLSSRSIQKFLPLSGFTDSIIEG